MGRVVGGDGKNEFEEEESQKSIVFYWQPFSFLSIITKGFSAQKYRAWHAYLTVCITFSYVALPS